MTDEIIHVQQRWTFSLAIQQQSVLLMACRGPDGMRKSHPAKKLIQAYRACVLNAASTGKPLTVAQPGDTYMNLDLMFNPPAWEEATASYLLDVDEIPHHYHLHLLHGAQIIGYKHPDMYFRYRWWGLYEAGVHDMHLYPETEAQMDARLNDFGRVRPLAALVPATEGASS